MLRGGLTVQRTDYLEQQVSYLELVVSEMPVPEQHVDHADILLLFEQVRRETVAPMFKT